MAFKLAKALDDESSEQNDLPFRAFL